MTIPVTVADLKPAPYNPRRIDEAALQGLGVSMQTFGDLSGITFNLRTQRLIAGHQRKQQLPPDGEILRFRAQADDDGQVGFAEIEADGKVWPVRFVDWPESKERAANVAANAPTIQGLFTGDLDALVNEIADNAPDIYDGLRLAAIIGAPADDQETDDPQTDAQPAEPLPPMELLPYEHYDYLIVLARNVNDWAYLCDRLGIQTVDATEPGVTSKGKTGLGRGVNATRLIKELRDV